MVNMAIKSEKRGYLQHKFTLNPKNFWKTLKFLNIHGNSSQSYSNIATAHEFNDFFINKLPVVTVDHEFIADCYVNKISPNIIEKFNFKLVTTQEVLEILNTFKSNAKGVDDINLKMLNLLMPHLVNHITFIINRCLATGYFPQYWKDAIVIPLPKNSSPTEISHYRPISLLSIISKVLEKVIQRQLIDYLNRFNVLPTTQSGFRVNHSTTTALLQVTDELFAACDNKETACLILLDYSKAFDTIDHATLCTKLKYFGLSPIVITFFLNYLSGRRQKVIFDGVSSTFVNVSMGVPQGSILGPLLFSIYTADLTATLKYMKSHQYADDMQLITQFLLKDLATAVQNINSDLESVSFISGAHGLILNEAKTELLVVGYHREQVINDPLFKITVNGVTLAPSDFCKNLGVYFDKDLRFSKHVNFLVQQSYGKLRSLHFHRALLISEVKLKLCDSLILSRIAYCDTVYWPAILNKDKESLQRVQNACLRFSYGLRKFDHVSEKFRQSKWLNLSERFQLHLACLVYKVENTKTPKYLYDKLVKGSDVHNFFTRYKDLFLVPQHSTALFQRSFSYNAASIYNKISQVTKSSNCVKSFRRQVKSNIYADRIY